jgi:hypothetical protein
MSFSNGRVRWSLLIATCIMASACGSSPPPATPAPARPDSAASPDSAARKDTAAGPLITFPNGLQYQDIVVGKGDPLTSYREATVHYVGKLLNGQIFDSSRDTGQPLSFVVGAEGMVAGFTQGVKGMRRLLVAPRLLNGGFSWWWWGLLNKGAGFGAGDRDLGQGLGTRG